VSDAQTPLVLVVIVGPQASGKSTLATALSAEMRRRGESVALVELDQIAAMALPTLPDWDLAHQIFESVTGQWARAGLTCVIAEGSGSQGEVSRLHAQVPDSAVTTTVAVTAPFAVALARAQRDPSRGVSREYEFLSAVYERWPAEMARIDADLEVDTNELSIEQTVECVRAVIGVARGRTPSSR
jgi:adenylylsulfate kinase-like enzyme